MSDDQSKTPGSERIDIHEDQAMRELARALATTPERIREAVQAVGDRVENVREYLGQSCPC